MLRKTPSASSKLAGNSQEVAQLQGQLREAHEQVLAGSAPSRPTLQARVLHALSSCCCLVLGPKLQPRAHCTFQPRCVTARPIPSPASSPGWVLSEPSSEFCDEWHPDSGCRHQCMQQGGPCGEWPQPDCQHPLRNKKLLAVQPSAPQVAQGTATQHQQACPMPGKRWLPTLTAKAQPCCLPATIYRAEKQQAQLACVLRSAQPNLWSLLVCRWLASSSRSTVLSGSATSTSASCATSRFCASGQSCRPSRWDCTACCATQGVLVLGCAQLAV